MERPEVTFTLAYVVFVVCFVFTPNEFRSAGVTVQNLLSGWLGSEDLSFIHYQIKRTSATALVHSILPLGKLLAFLNSFCNDNVVPIDVCLNFLFIVI